MYGQAASSNEVPTRLSPEMASFKLLVYAYVRDYIGKMGASPSQGEIVNALESTRTRVRHAIKACEADGLLIRTPGHRGLKLRSTRDAAIRELRQMGFVINESIQHGYLPGGPNPALLQVPELDYIPPRTEGHDGEESGSGRRAAAA